MGDVQFKDHIIMEYPQAGKYTVLFREGGIQNFCMKLDDLPPKLKQVIKDAKAEGRVHSFQAGSLEPVTQKPEDMLGDSGFRVNVYSNLF